MSQCKQCKNQFKIDAKDKAFYKRLNVPEPTFCPPCRMQRRFAFRNERQLYHRKCDLTGKQIISIHAPESEGGRPLKVFDYDEWWSDKWDHLETGRDFDFKRPFFEQFKELQEVTPRLPLMIFNSENSDYTNMAADNKNCYILFAAENCEDCLYGKLVQNCKDCIDCNFIYDSTLCYESVNLVNCYNTYFSENCSNCNDVWFSYGLRNCKYCLFCSNLRNKEYCINNKQYTKDEFFKMFEPKSIGSYKNLQKMFIEFEKLKSESIVRAAEITNSENSTGDFLQNCKNCFDCYDVTNGHDCRYLTDALDPKDTYDSSFIYYKPELCYETMSTLQLNNVHFSSYCYYCNDLQYCDVVYNSSDCFGCVGLKKQKFCIFNKQYSEEEYKSLKAKIIEHMKKTGEYGEFFPVELSPFGYNETVAQEYFPLDKEKIIKNGWRFKEDTKDFAYQGPKYEIPDDIKDVPNDITGKILECEKSKKLYKITPQELSFYKRNYLPIPRLSPDERHYARMQRRNPRSLWDRKCQKCSKSIKTTYAPERPQTVYCEECFLKDVY